MSVTRILYGTENSNIQSIEYTDELMGMVDLGVEDVHCYYANGVVTHNCAEEMRLAANFSNEPNFITPLQEGKDIHSYIAEKMFGYSNPEHRTAVKVLNFATLYGANEYTISRRLGKSVEEAKGILDNYKKTNSRLTRWQEESIKEGRRKGIIYTYFGRPRTVFQYFNSSDRSQHGYAARTCMNAPIQGCLPLDSFIELSTRVVRLKDVLGQRLVDSEGHVLVPTHRGSNEPLFVVFKSGDFCVCDINHKFITGSLKEPKEASVRDGLTFKGKLQKVILSPVGKKSFRFTKHLFKSIEESLAYVRLTCKANKEVSKGNRILSTAFFKLCISRKWFSYDYNLLVTLPSLVNLYGYNVIYSPKKDKLRIVPHRKKSTTLRFIKCLLSEGKEVEVGSCTVLNGLPLYKTGSLYSRNTGGDLIRLKLVDIVSQLQSNEELRNNVRFAMTVHDECNFYVKSSYLYKALQWLNNLMYFKPSNFQVPLVVSLSVGYDYGHQLDIQPKECNDDFYIGQDDKIHHKIYDNL